LEGESGPKCQACLYEDEQEAELQRFWVAHERRQTGMLDAILSVAPRVCSNAELDVLQERLYGLSDDQIAERLNLSRAKVRRLESRPTTRSAKRSAPDPRPCYPVARRTKGFAGGSSWGREPEPGSKAV